ncbi:Crp/Fnr family transcriptional regulator [Falsihalocynthiibacter arcticus]|uniref:Crp/Fnr family transcriptional regulator n=1 Tax=Falsihalocynthiibacter arcticus TaxID=1579316 RepID=UPI002FFBBA2B
MSDANARSFSHGQMIFSHGDIATSIFIVIEGWVKLFRVTPNGAEAVMGVFTQGRSFGEAVAFKGDTYPVSAEAVTDAKVIQVSASKLLDLMQARPEVCTAVLASTFAHLHGLVSQIEQLKAQTGAQRVAEFLMSLADCEHGKCSVTLPYDKALIAGRLGMKPESLSRAFAKLRSVGVTVNRNSADIENLEDLADYAEGDPAEAWSK